jgi:branched-chain amino acid transport system substrate-binding protein
MRTFKQSTILITVMIVALSLVLGACQKPAPPEKKAPVREASGEAFPMTQGQSQPTQGVTDTEIKLGAWGPLTGPGASWGAVIKGTKAYFDWINEQGGIHGRKLTYIMRDDGYMPPRTVAAAKELAERQKVFAFVTGIGTATGMAVKDYLDEKRMINIGMGSGARAWTDPISKYRFSTYPEYRTESSLLVRYAAKELGLKKIAMFYQNDGYGKEGLTGAEQAVEKYGAEFVAKVSYELSDTDLSSQALKLKASGAQVVIVWSTAKHAATLAKESAKLAFKPQFLATSTLSDPILFKLAGEAWNGTIIANWMPMHTDETEGMKAYRAAVAKYAPDQVVGNFTLAGFILAEPFVEGLKRAGRDLTTESLVAALESIKNFNGAYVHDLTFGPGDRQGPDSIYFIKAEDGKLKRISDWMNPE